MLPDPAVFPVAPTVAVVVRVGGAVADAGNVSVSVTPVAVLGPEFVIVSVYDTDEPGVTVETPAVVWSEPVALVTVIVYVALRPGLREVTPSSLVIDRSALRVTVPIWPAVDSANARLLFGPTAIPASPAPAVIPDENSVIVPS